MGGFTLRPAEFVTVGSQAAGWTFDSNSPLLGANDFVHSGTKSLKITNATATNSFSHQDVSVTGGRVYSLQGWIKTTALSTVSGGGAVLNVDTVSGVTGFTIVSKNTGGGVTDFSAAQPDIGLPADGTARDWTFVQCLFKPTGSGVIRLYCQLGYAVAGSSGSAWFDDIGIFPTGAAWTGLSASTSYYLYSYIDAVTGWIQYANGNPPPTSPSDSLAQQCTIDGRISLPVKKITTPASGSSGSDTGGGSGTCPEFDAPVFVRRYSAQDGVLVFEGTIKAGEVQPGYESDDGTIKRGDFIKGYSFKQQADVYRAVINFHVPCAGWMKIDGWRFTSCETVWDGPFDSGQWLQAWKVPGAEFKGDVGVKVLITVEADWDDEHNYFVGPRLIHNTPILPC